MSELQTMINLGGGVTRGNKGRVEGGSQRLLRADPMLPMSRSWTLSAELVKETARCSTHPIGSELTLVRPPSSWTRRKRERYGHFYPFHYKNHLTRFIATGVLGSICQQKE